MIIFQLLNHEISVFFFFFKRNLCKRNKINIYTLKRGREREGYCTDIHEAFLELTQGVVAGITIMIYKKTIETVLVKYYLNPVFQSEVTAALHCLKT